MGGGKQIGTRTAARPGKPDCCQPNYPEAFVGSVPPCQRRTIANVLYVRLSRACSDSLSTQTARTHFQALARNYPILNHFDSPADVIAQLHEREEVKLVYHIAWNEILHALVDSIADGTAEATGQQLFLVAYTPAIHTYIGKFARNFPGCVLKMSRNRQPCASWRPRGPQRYRASMVICPARWRPDFADVFSDGQWPRHASCFRCGRALTIFQNRQGTPSRM
jgi:hypothetical protein